MESPKDRAISPSMLVNEQLRMLVKKIALRRMALC